MAAPGAGLPSRSDQVRGAVTAPLLVSLLLTGAACGGGAPSGEGAAPASDTSAAAADPAADDPDGQTSAAPDAGDGVARSAGNSDAQASVGADTSDASAETKPGEPEWMRVDEAAKQVELDIVAGLTPENSSWNFNGYANGDMTITVPAGWSVVMNFSNHDGDVPHSVYILEQGPPYPTVMPERPVIPRAYSTNLQSGLGAGKTDVLRFTSGTAGTFTMPCGVLGHAAAGMWDHFVVSAKADRPSVQTTS